MREMFAIDAQPTDQLDSMKPLVAMYGLRNPFTF